MTCFSGIGCSRGHDLWLFTTVFSAPGLAILHQIGTPLIFFEKRKWVRELMNAHRHMAAQAFMVLSHRQKTNFWKIEAILLWAPPKQSLRQRSSTSDLFGIYLLIFSLSFHPRKAKNKSQGVEKWNWEGKKANKGCDFKSVTTTGNRNLILLGNFKISASKVSPSVRVFLHHSCLSFIKAAGRAEGVHLGHSCPILWHRQRKQARDIRASRWHVPKWYSWGMGHSQWQLTIISFKASHH